MRPDSEREWYRGRNQPTSVFETRRRVLPCRTIGQALDLVGRLLGTSPGLLHVDLICIGAKHDLLKGVGMSGVGASVHLWRWFDPLRARRGRNAIACSSGVRKSPSRTRWSEHITLGESLGFEQGIPCRHSVQRLLVPKQVRCQAALLPGSCRPDRGLWPRSDSNAPPGVEPPCTRSEAALALGGVSKQA